MAISLQILKPILLQSRLIDEEKFNEYLEKSQRTGQNLVDILVSEGVITREYFIELLSNYLQIPRVHLKGKDISYDILNLIPEDIARSRSAIIFGKEGRYLQVAMTDPTDLEAIEFLERYTNTPIKVYITTEDDLRNAFALYRQHITENFKNIIEANLKQAVRIEGLSLAEAAAELPIVSLFDTIIEYAASLNATDIHLERLSDSVLNRSFA